MSMSSDTQQPQDICCRLTKNPNCPSSQMPVVMVTVELKTWFRQTQRQFVCFLYVLHFSASECEAILNINHMVNLCSMLSNPENPKVFQTTFIISHIVATAALWLSEGHHALTTSQLVQVVAQGHKVRKTRSGGLNQQPND